MAESDSDLEILEELPSQRESSSSSRKHVFDAESDDELLDLDYNDDIVGSKTSGSSFGSRRSSRKSSKKSSCSDKPLKTVKVPQIVLSDDEDMENEKKSDRGSDATDVIDDDVESLPDIPLPSPPPPTSSQKKTGYDNGRKYSGMDVNSDPYPIYSSSSSTATTITRTTTTGSSKGSSQSSFFADLEAQEVDNLFRDAEYASLADYLAETERKKRKKSPDNSKPFRLEKKAEKSSFKGIPSFSDFACQQQETITDSKSKSKVKAKPAAKTRSTEEIVSEIQESYQVNKKSSNRSRAKKKDKENSAVTVGATTSGSSSSLPTSSVDSEGQGKLKKPKDPLKMIVLHVAENVLTDELATKLIEKEVQFQIVGSPVIPDSILFEHNVPYKLAGMDGQISEKFHKEIDANIAIIFRIDQHLELLQGELDRDCDSEPPSEPSQSLSDWIQNISKNNPGKKITLLMQGLEAYLRKIQRAVQKEYRDRVLKGDKPDNGKKKRKANSQGINLTRFEIQNALISAQLETNMHYRLYETNTDLSLLLSQYAKSIGEAPYKLEKMKSTDFDWYAVADAVGGIPVDENGQGMRSLWIAQLTQFPGVGQESALAIARVYGSPKLLYQAYRRCTTVQEGKDLLANIQVTMGVGPLAKSRRLGPEASKKIYRFFTSTDGEREIHV